MKICYALLLGYLLAQPVLAQTKPSTRKPLKPTPDLIGLITVNPESVHGSTTLTAFIDVIETKKVPTSGVITVYVLKISSFIDFTFDPKATAVGENNVQNASWSLDATTNPDYYIFTSTKTIAGGAVSTIGLTGTFTPSTAGKTGLTMSISQGSGGEINHGNNVASTAITYWPK
ncbi:hypothetical protein [Spirosoma sp. KNUC1025]|uniref:hypothetical protein n=1 Tax=Spirosoma sp. KNUC1025 TaxID=2894082 RepID=UPI0038635DE3|nr:hypothetical protein LN737_25555 [Spirosoma sp. KNUC1025]